MLFQVLQRCTHESDYLCRAYKAKKVNILNEAFGFPQSLCHRREQLEEVGHVCRNLSVLDREVTDGKTAFDEVFQVVRHLVEIVELFNRTQHKHFFDPVVLDRF